MYHIYFKPEITFMASKIEIILSVLHEWEYIKDVSHYLNFHKFFHFEKVCLKLLILRFQHKTIYCQCNSYGALIRNQSIFISLLFISMHMKWIKIKTYTNR